MTNEFKAWRATECYVNFGGEKYPTAEKSTQILQSSSTEHPRHALRFQVLLIILIV